MVGRSSRLGQTMANTVGPTNKVVGKHTGYKSPIFGWVPSVAVSSLLQVQGFDQRWDGDLLVAFTKGTNTVSIARRWSRGFCIPNRSGSVNVYATSRRCRTERLSCGLTTPSCNSFQSIREKLEREQALSDLLPAILWNDTVCIATILGRPARRTLPHR